MLEAVIDRIININANKDNTKSKVIPKYFVIDNGKLYSVLSKIVNTIIAILNTTNKLQVIKLNMILFFLI